MFEKYFPEVLSKIFFSCFCVLTCKLKQSCCSAHRVEIWKCCIIRNKAFKLLKCCRCTNVIARIRLCFTYYRVTKKYYGMTESVAGFAECTFMGLAPPNTVLHLLRKGKLIPQNNLLGKNLSSLRVINRDMICAKFLVNQILLWRKFYWRLNPECRLNFPVNGNASHCSGDGAWPGITDEAPQCSEPPGNGSYNEKHERAIPGNNVQSSLNINAVTKDSPEFRKEVFSISKPNRDSQISGGQIRPQQVQVKLGMLNIEFWKVVWPFLLLL